jgi:hypothetical protein
MAFARIEQTRPLESDKTLVDQGKCSKKFSQILKIFHMEIVFFKP